MSKREWYVDHFGGDDHTRVVRNRADRDAIVAGPVDYRRYESCTIVEGIEESDAALIAAAPDMLAALEAVAALEKAGGEVPCSVQNEAWSKVHAAIARATGES